MTSPRAAHRRDGDAAAQGLGQGAQVRRHTVVLLGAAAAHPETRQDLVEDQDKALAGAGLPHEAQELRGSGDAALVVGNRLQDHRRQRVLVGGDCPAEGVGVVEGNDHDEVAHRVGHPVGIGQGSDRAVRTPLADPRRAIVPEVVVHAVEVALELEDLRLPGVSAGDPDCAHGRLGSAVREADRLRARNCLGHHVGQAGVVFGLSVADDADIERLQDGRPDGGVVVAQEVGPAAREEVDVFLAVHVPESGSLAAGQVERPLEQGVHPPARSRAADQVPLRRLVELLTSHGSPLIGTSSLDGRSPGRSGLAAPSVGRRGRPSRVGGASGCPAADRRPAG